MVYTLGASQILTAFYERGSQAKNLPGPARQLKLLTASLLPIKPENCGCEPGSAATRSATTHCFSFQRGNISRRSCGNCGKLGARFLRRVFQARWERRKTCFLGFPPFPRSGSFHSFCWSSAYLSSD